MWVIVQSTALPYWELDDNKQVLTDWARNRSRKEWCQKWKCNQNKREYHVEITPPVLVTMILWIVFSNPWQCLTALVSLAGAMMRCDLMLTTRKFNLSQIFWEGIIICASSVFLTHLGIARSERCGLSHKMDGKPLDYFLVLVIHDIHHLSVQTHEHLNCDLIRNDLQTI